MVFLPTQPTRPTRPIQSTHPTHPLNPPNHHRLSTFCNYCSKGRPTLEQCKARNEVVIPDDIANHSYPGAKAIFVGKIISLYMDSLEYYKLQKDKAAHVDGKGVVLGEGGRPVHYIHQGDTKSSSGKRLINYYYTCGCCRCQGLKKWCGTWCVPTKCIRRHGTKEMTLEKVARAEVEALVETMPVAEDDAGPQVDVDVMDWGSSSSGGKQQQQQRPVVDENEQPNRGSSSSSGGGGNGGQWKRPRENDIAAGGQQQRQQAGAAAAFLDDDEEEEMEERPRKFKRLRRAPAEEPMPMDVNAEGVADDDSDIMVIDPDDAEEDENVAPTNTNAAAAAAAAAAGAGRAAPLAPPAPGQSGGKKKGQPSILSFFRKKE